MTIELCSFMLSGVLIALGIFLVLVGKSEDNSALVAYGKVAFVVGVIGNIFDMIYLLFWM